MAEEPPTDEKLWRKVSELDTMQQALTLTIRDLDRRNKELVQCLQRVQEIARVIAGQVERLLATVSQREE